MRGTKRVSGQTRQNLEAEFRRQIDSIFHSIMATRAPIETVSEAFHAVQDRLGFERLPANARDRLFAYYHGQWQGLWRFADWRVYWRGAFYYSPYRQGASWWHLEKLGHGTARPNSEILTGTWNEVDPERSRHFWIDSDLPFTRERAPEVGAEAERG